MSVLTAMGVSVEVPPGWEVEIDAGAHRPQAGGGSENSRVGRSIERTPVAMTRIHAANFALPARRGDFGSGAVETMGPSDILICVLEEDPSVAASALYKTGGLPVFSAEEFDPNRMQRPIRGQSGAQAFFHTPTRAFVAYVVLGSHRNRHRGVTEVNRVLAGINPG